MRWRVVRKFSNLYPWGKKMQPHQCHLVKPSESQDGDGRRFPVSDYHVYPSHEPPARVDGVKSENCQPLKATPHPAIPHRRSRLSAKCCQSASKNHGAEQQLSRAGEVDNERPPPNKVATSGSARTEAARSMKKKKK
ncbi:sodium channel, voltage-gated, type VIII, alpha a [Anopheles sinensis]|uniref:Sodium channel, voltage-gated, type VIII, alpha a n=1 Tax=Anopheles sinensis TaxID=74873 RepID=A0A084WU02_ANOSI|nr:sodium channel, voltage-gated, type VIII, alpha a [Anopheles sinensis]